jgi:hypothetical protein
MSLGHGMALRALNCRGDVIRGKGRQRECGAVFYRHLGNKYFGFTQGKDYLIRRGTFIPPAFLFGSSQVSVQIHQGASSGLPPIAQSIVGSNFAFSELGGTPFTQRPVFELWRELRRLSRVDIGKLQPSQISKSAPK